MKFKVGDRIKRVSGEIGDRLKIGDIGIIKAILIGTNSYRVINERTREVQTWGDDYIDIEPSQTIVIYPKGLETIALLKEGKKVIKQATAKCNPSDTFDFNIGAKLAFSRLMGEDLTVKEIEVAHSGSIDWEGFKSGKFAVHCDTEEKAKAFLKECDEQGIKWCTNTKISDQKETRWDIYKNNTSYGCDSFWSDGGLMFGTFDNIPKIDYTPSNTIREVKRPAKVGEWIKVVNARNSFGYYSDGDIFKVLENGDNWSPGAAIVGSTDVFPYIGANEYVVLENYQPEATKTLSDCTDKELIDELSKRLEDKQ
jgi:hypothetical protein